MPYLKPPRVTFNEVKVENSKRKGWRHAIFSSQTKKIFKAHYIGQWKNDKKEGKGQELDRDGWMYEGDWFDNKKCGYGVLSRVTKFGDIYKHYAGHWLAGKKHGFGSNWYVDGSYYEGIFSQNLRHDYGRIWYSDGSYYQGMWKNDRYDGLGMLIQANGNRYEGQFVDGKKEGYGVHYHLDTGQVQYGFWKNDCCLNGIMKDTYWRQSALHPTPHPIPENEPMKCTNNVPSTHKVAEDSEITEKDLLSRACKITRRAIPSVYLCKNLSQLC